MRDDRRPETATGQAMINRDDCQPTQECAPTRYYKIQIDCAQNGYICQVGCMTVVFETKKKMLMEISRYLENPEKVEKEYQKKKRS